MGFFDKLEGIVKEVNNAINSPQTNNRSNQGSNTTANYFPQELEKLISIVLVDGHITDQEKQVLYKKAMALGVDIDELEIVLNARMAESCNTITSQSKKSTASSPASNKCLGCGAPIDPLKLKCPDCGQEYTSLAIQRLLDKLDEVDIEYRRACKDYQDKKANAKSFLERISLSSPDETSVWERKGQIIQSFKLPATKIDTLEFLSAAVPCIKKEKVTQSFFKRMHSIDEEEYDEEMYESEYDYLSPIWKRKCEQVILKAKVMAKNDPEYLNEVMEIVKPIGIR